MRVVVLGASFGGGLELATMPAEAGVGDVDVSLIDKSDAFVFGYSKGALVAEKHDFGASRSARRFGN